MSHAVNYIHHAPEYIVGWVLLVSLAMYLKSIVLLVFAVFVFITLLFFFRGWVGDANRPEKQIMICPCDGKVLDVVMHIEQGYVQIAIFLNVHNVHVQYVPCFGRVLSVLHKDGEFHPAYMFQKSALNERTETIIDSPDFGQIKVVQIAGLVARRIVSFLDSGQAVIQGQPLGLIKLGSRVDVWIPLQNGLVVPLLKDQRVHIGDTLAVIQA